MRTRTATLGVLFATTTAIVWGGQFVVGKSALESVNAFPLSTIRYALASALWLLLLLLVQGRRSLRLDGRGGEGAADRDAAEHEDEGSHDFLHHGARVYCTENETGADSTR